MSAAPAPEAASGPLPAAAPASVEGVAPTVADLPTRKGPKGILFDFNDGCRVVLPEAEQPWRVRLSDLDTGNILFETELKAGRINSTKRYYVRFRIEVWQQDKSVFATTIRRPGATCWCAFRSIRSAIRSAGSRTRPGSRNATAAG
jgi:hypothetical protein